MMRPKERNCGFTLIEAVITIVLTGILAAVVAVFIGTPVVGYLQMAQRAELTDAADTAMRRIARDLHGALPNSVRATGTTQLEFIPIKSAGRYRADPTAAAGGNPLDFNSAADTFDVLNQGGADVANGDFIVIYNLGVAPADAYDTVAANSSRRQATAPFGTGLAVTGFNGGAFPFSSPAKRFQVVGTPAAYACSGGVLTRYWNYAYGSAITSGSSAPIVQNVTGCRFTYQAGVTALNGLVTMELSIALSGESVDLVNQVHINNVP